MTVRANDNSGQMTIQGKIFELFQTFEPLPQWFQKGNDNDNDNTVNVNVIVIVVLLVYSSSYYWYCVIVIVIDWFDISKVLLLRRLACVKTAVGTK